MPLEERGNTWSQILIKMEKIQVEKLYILKIP